jgi:PhzF family phenazine biosynthesis protein
MAADVQLVSVFSDGPGGGNPAPIVLDASGWSDTDMQALAHRFGHESSFVVPVPAGSGADFALRFWVPRHEMAMCGHATVGTIWLLNHLGRLPGSPGDKVSIWTRSGTVTGRVLAAAEPGGPGPEVEISQPSGLIDPVEDGLVPQILSVLGLTAAALGPTPVLNASTSRVKTLIPLVSTAVLDELRPDYDRIESLCERLGSTGLYPFACHDRQARVYDARQFPASSGYPEDAATGIAAAALSFGLLRVGLVNAVEGPILVRQGRAMGRPSLISIRFGLTAGRVSGCWLGGRTELRPPVR